jgi:hypothetical protein
MAKGTTVFSTSGRGRFQIKSAGKYPLSASGVRGRAIISSASLETEELKKIIRS